MKPTISVIIIDKDDRGIADTLNGLKHIALPAPTEIIVVDASAPDVLADIRDAHPEVHWIPYKARPGLGKSSIPEQRNLGIRASLGSIIAFIDANCVPERDWLTKLVAPILSGQEMITTGRITANNPKTLTASNPVHAAGLYRTSAGAANLSFTREVFERVGGFDEGLDFGSDVDFTWRSINLGYRILWVPDARMSHDWGTTGDEIRRAFKYGRSKAILYAKHRSRIKPFAEDMFIPMYLIYVIGLPLTIWFPWYPLVILLPMARNIGHRPFKTAVINFTFTMGFARQTIVLCANKLRKLMPESAKHKARYEH